jgi:predicted small metal-binding protein
LSSSAHKTVILPFASGAPLGAAAGQPCPPKIFARDRTARVAHPNVNGRSTLSEDEPVEARMYQFQCGHQECFSQCIASNKDDLMQQVAEHLKEAHNVDHASQTLMSYLEATCVTTK